MGHVPIYHNHKMRSSPKDIYLRGIFELKGQIKNVMGKRAYFSKAKVGYNPVA